MSFIMNGHSQVIFMQGTTKKILISVLAISVLSFFLFLGLSYNQGSLASLYSVITAWVTINPLEVDVSASPEIIVDKVFKITAEIINKGEEKIENVEAEIHLPSELVIKKKSVQRVGVIQGKKQKKVSWTVKGTEPGNYIILVSASAKLKGDLINAEDSISIEVKENISSTGFFQRFFDFFQEWFRF